MLIGVLARGTLAGYVATAAMDASQTSIIPAVGDWIVNRLGKSGGDTAQPQEDNGGGDEPSLSSPALVARRAASLAGAELDREQAELWGNRVHWAYGVQWGIVLLLLRRRPGPGFGLLYGAALWLLSDELLLWALVTTISFATITAWINAGGLGTLLFNGITRNNQSMILAGTIAVTALALLADQVMRLLERLTAVSRARRAASRNA
jgi:hypothetical protein